MKKDELALVQLLRDTLEKSRNILEVGLGYRHQCISDAFKAMLHLCTIIMLLVRNDSPDDLNYIRGEISRMKYDVVCLENSLSELEKENADGNQ